VADVNRANSLLDEAFDPKPGKKSRRKRKEGLSKDQVRRLAFRVLASISQYDRAPGNTTGGTSSRRATNQWEDHWHREAGGRSPAGKLRWVDSNHRPPGYEPGKLPLLYTAISGSAAAGG
jgi:hypothetical protein